MDGCDYSISNFLSKSVVINIGSHKNFIAKCMTRHLSRYVDIGFILTHQCHSVSLLVLVSVHQPSIPPIINQGGNSALNIYGGNNTIGPVSITAVNPSSYTPDLPQGKT